MIALSGVRNSWLTSASRRCCEVKSPSNLSRVWLKELTRLPISSFSGPWYGMRRERSSARLICSTVSVMAPRGLSVCPSVNQTTIPERSTATTQMTDSTSIRFSRAASTTSRLEATCNTAMMFSSSSFRSGILSTRMCQPDPLESRYTGKSRRSAPWSNGLLTKAGSSP